MFSYPEWIGLIENCGINLWWYVWVWVMGLGKVMGSG